MCLTCLKLQLVSLSHHFMNWILDLQGVSTEIILWFVHSVWTKSLHHSVGSSCHKYYQLYVLQTHALLLSVMSSHPLVFILKLEGNSWKEGSKDWYWVNGHRWILCQVDIPKDCQFSYYCSTTYSLCKEYNKIKYSGEKPQSHEHIYTYLFSYADYHSCVKSSLSSLLWPPT